jgi:photosystem II stability/assembly factor-like uncharacterized protein
MKQNLALAGMHSRSSSRLPAVLTANASTVLLCLFCGFLAYPAPAKDLAKKENQSDRRQRVLRLERQEEREYRQRAFPLAEIPQGARQRALDQIQQAERLSPASLTFGGGYAWFNLGPSPLLSTTLPGGTFIPNNAGRVSALAVDPFAAGHWLLGAAQGGIWETIDGGFNWSPKTDDQPSLAMGAIQFAPNNPKIVYGGTGEGNFSADSYAGMGLLKSINGGTSWFVVAVTPFAETAFSEIKVNSSDPNILAVATARGVMGKVQAGTNIPPAAPARGIFVSHNGGTNWTHTLFGEGTDVEIDSGNFDRQYAALGEILGAPSNGVYRTTNGGTNWIRINGPWMSAGATNLGRIRIAMAPNIPNRVYVSIGAKRGQGDLIGIFRTDNAWAATPTWLKISADGAPAAQFTWYSHDLSVHPANPDIVYFVGSSNVWRFDGSTWLELPDQHPDQHALAWIPTFDPSVWRALVGHDGGVSSRFDNFGGWSSHLNGLAITQFYKGAVDPQDSSILLGASQDNGTELYSGVPGWTPKIWGDGFSCAIASYPNDKLWWAVSHQFDPVSGTAILRTKDGGKNFSNATFGIDAESIDFFVGFEKHPSNDDIFLAGTANLWRCESFFSASTPIWTVNSPALLTSNGTTGQVTAIAFAASDSLGATYAYGTHDGQLRLTSNAGMNWTDIDALHAVPDRYVSGLAFSPTNAQELYVTLSGFNEGTPGHPGHVFKTTNALDSNPSWSNVSPPVNIPVDCIVVNPTHATDVFAGCDLGVFNSSDGGQTWTHLGPSVGMPNVAVFDLRFDNLGSLTAFTHGRGAFVYRHQPIITTPLCPIACLIPWINPGDLVTIELPLSDVLPIDTGELTAVLRPTGQVTPAPGSELQNYGHLSAAGGVVTRQFQFRANIGTPGAGFSPESPADGCGGTGNLIFDLSDAGVSLGSISFPFHLGRQSQPLLQDFESAIVPALPRGWIGNAAGGPGGWVTTSNAPPNVMAAGDPDEVGDAGGELTGPVSISAFIPDPPRASDWSLYSPAIPIATDRAQLSFRHSFDAEPNFDGGVLEIAIGAQPFADILAAGGSFADNGYNATMFATSGPLGGRRAWSGDSGGWLITQVNLPPTAAGQNIQLRWRFTSDASVGRDGWFIDDLSINQYQCVPPVPNPVIVRPGFFRVGAGTQFGFFIDTVPSRNYFVEYKNALSDAFWQPLQTLNGDGTPQFMPDSSPGLTQRFYRFRVE